MHRYFAEWYRVATLNPQSVNIQSRWQALEQVVNEITTANAFELVRLFHGLPPKSKDYTESFRSAFQATDPAFSMRGNELELRVLAGATINHLIEEKDGEFADAVALANFCASYQELRPPTPVPEIVTNSRDYIGKRAIALRTSNNPTLLKISSLNIEDHLEKLKTAMQSNDGAQMAKTIGPPFDVVDTAIRQFTTSVNKALEHLNRELEIQQEESNILWWLFAEHSNDLGQQMTELSLSVACLVAAKELAELTMLIPGPASAEAVLDKMLHAVKRKLPQVTSLQDAVNAAPREWKVGLLRETNIKEIDDICFTHLALTKSIEGGEKNEWVSLFEKTAGFRPSAPIHPVKLCLQLYQERLLIEAVNSLS